MKGKGMAETESEDYDVCRSGGSQAYKNTRTNAGSGT